ncbi:MAG: hypothetical protein ACRDJU_11410 [Actinomycetota bacterium]
MAATLKLNRKWGGLVYAQSDFDISIDGAVVGSIGVRETKELAVDPGHHVLRMGRGRHLSPERSFDVGEGDVVSFWCRGTFLWPVYLAALLKPDLWISLKKGF